MNQPDFYGSCRMSGPAGTAERIVLPDPPENSYQRVTIAAWFLDAPGQHPIWDNYLLSVIHLRPTDGVPALPRHYPAAEYEVGLFVLDPEQKPHPADMASLVLLAQANFAAQWHGTTDSEAETVAMTLATSVVRGKLPAEPPDTAGHLLWIKALRQTLEAVAPGRGQVGDH